MRYIIIILLSLSLPAVALVASAPNDRNDKAKVLQQKIQKKVGKDVCDPKKELHMGPFN